MPAHIAPRPTRIELVAASISVHEGWNVPASLVRRQHNPGALVYARQRGAWRGKNIYAWFPTDAAGKAALIADLSAKFRRGMTLGQVMARWSAKSYGKQVARETGIGEDEVVRLEIHPSVAVDHLVHRHVELATRDMPGTAKSWLLECDHLARQPMQSKESTRLISLWNGSR